MKTKINPFISTALLVTGLIVFSPCARAADQLWIGSAGDHNVTTASNWVGGAPSVDNWSPFVFGSDVIDGTVNLDRWVAINSLTLNSGLTHDITIDSGPIIMGGSLVDMSSAGANLTLNAQLQQGWGEMTFNVGAGRTLTSNGGVAESVWFSLHTGLTKEGAGTAVITSPATYTLGTTLNAGTLKVAYNGGGNGGVGTLPVGSSITVNSGATLLGSAFNGLGYASTHAGDSLTVHKGGSLTVDAGTVLSMPYALNIVGGTISSVDGGDPTLGTIFYQSTQGTFTSASDGTPATISAQNFNLQGAQFNVVHGSGAVDLNVTGSFGGGALTKNGNGVMQLTTAGAVGYNGGTTVNDGTLIMPSGSWQLNHIANWPMTVNAGATLELPANPSEWAVAPTLIGGTITCSGAYSDGWPNITLDANLTISAGGAAISTIATSVGVTANTTFSVGSGSTLKMTGPILEAFIASRTGVIKTDAGTLTLSSAANNYDCDTTISGGTLAIGGAGQLNGGNYGYNIINNAALVYGSSATQTLSGNISGTGTLTQNAGTLTLSGTNSYGGATTVNGGTLVIGNAAAAGGTSGITVNFGSFLVFDSGTAGGTISTPISLIGGDFNWNMETTVANNQITFTGPITLSGSALIVSQGNNSTLIFNNAFHGTEGLTFAALSGGKNFMVVSAPSDFSGDFSVINWAGSPQVTLSGGDNRLPSTTVVRLAGSAGSPSALDLNGNNQTLAGLGEPSWGGMDAGARHVVNTSGTAAILTLNTTTDQSSGATIGGTDINGTAGNDLSLVKSGGGKQTLSGANTYSGNTTVNGGTLSLGQVNSNHESSTVSIAAAAGAKLDLAFSGTDTVGTLFINGVQQPAGNYTSAHASAAFSGSGTLQVTSGPAGFAGWISGTFANGATVPVGQQGAANDPDHDGISNLMEYALAGLDPTVPNGAIGTFSGNTLSYTKRQPLAADLSYVIETSPDLRQPWTAQVTQAPGNTDATISYALPTGQGKLFARLRVEQQ